MRFDWQKAESSFWSCVLTSSSSSCLLSWWAPHYPFKQKWQTTVPLPGCSHTQWELGWGQRHWLNISLFQDKQVVWIKVGQNRLNIIKGGYKTRIEWCSASLHSLGDSRADGGIRKSRTHKTGAEISYDTLPIFPSLQDQWVSKSWSPLFPF